MFQKLLTEVGMNQRDAVFAVCNRFALPATRNNRNRTRLRGGLDVRIIYNPLTISF
jgi:hypothetical protein